jgi:aminoglycoside phosphotransferase
LEELSLGHNVQFGDEAAIAASRWSKLRKLELPSCGLSDDAVKSLSKLKALEELDLAGNAKLGTVAINTLVKRLKRLRKLNLRSCRVNESTVRLIASLRELQGIDVSHCRDLTGRGVALLATLPKLQEMNLSGCTGIDDECVEKFAAVPGLKRVYAFGCTGVDEATFVALSRARPKLQLEWKEEE